MSKSRTRKRATERKQNQRSLIYRGLIGAVILIAIAAIILLSRSPSGQVTVDGERPVWQTTSLTDARTGETFTLADFNEKDVFVKIMSPF